jgi:hypothetical protein
MILAYFLCKALPGRFAYSLPLVFAAAVAPDADLLFHSLMPHHTITHSITFWSLFYAPLAAAFRLKVVPYAAATFSHFLVGDLATGDPPLLYGISDQHFGIARPWINQQFGHEYGILYQAAVDVAMIAALSIFALARKDLRPLFSHDARHVIVLAAVVFIIFAGAYANDIDRAMHKPASLWLYAGYGLVALSHALFLAVLAKGTLARKKRPIPDLPRQKF